MDSLIYPEVEPLWPLRGNPLHDVWEYPEPSLALLLVVGVKLHLAHAYATTRRRSRPEAALAQLGLLSALSSLVLASTLSPLLLPVSLALAAGGVIAFYSSLLKLSSVRRRALASLLLVMTSIAAVAADAFLGDPPLSEAWLGSSRVLIPWATALVGLLLLRRPLRSVALGDRKVAPPLDLLAVGWALAPLLVGIPVVAIALLLLASRVAPAIGRENRAEGP